MYAYVINNIFNNINFYIEIVLDKNQSYKHKNILFGE